MSHLHRFLNRHIFYPLLLTSLLAGGIYAGRVMATGAWHYRFLVWNLFLAWIPYGAALWAAALHTRAPGRWWRLLPPAALWLLFLPNAPYILTDFIHYPGMDFIWWYDLGLLAAFAWSGCFLGVTSLYTMQEIARAFVGRLGSWLFVLGTAGLSGVGIYLGRFMRWNSWDVVFQPRALAADVAMMAGDPFSILRLMAVSSLFAAIVFVSYITFAMARPPEAIPHTLR